MTVALAALAGTATAKPTCVVVHAVGRHALVLHVAEALRARLARSQSFVVGDGRKERSLHITLRYGAVRLPEGAQHAAGNPSNINAALSYRTPGEPPGFEGMSVIGLRCDERATNSCVETIVRMAYIFLHADHSVAGTFGPSPVCLHRFNPRCTSTSAF